MFRFALVDAFSSAPFAGNPAGVVLLDGPVDERWAQQLAAEVRASETAFVHPGDDGWGLRWFTPTAEVDLCGHATLASAHVLWHTGAAVGPLRFSTRSGPLGASSGDDGRIWLDLPSWPVRAYPQPPSLQAALAGTAGRYLGRTAGTTAPSGSPGAGGADGADEGGGQPNDVVEVADETTLRALEPDLEAVRALGSTGLIVTAHGTDVDLVSRYFAPAIGVDEDPVTGSAHSTLAPLWAQRLGRTELTARQVSPRGGELALRLDGDRVHVGGSAVIVIAGEVVGPT